MTLLLCDLDDTLVPRQAIFSTWATGYMRELEAPESDLSWFVEVDEDGIRPRPDFFRLVIDRYALPDSIDELAERYHYDYIASFRCEPVVRDALQRVRHAGFKVAIITNGDVRSQAAKIAATGLADLVDACCISEAEGHWKPAPELFRIAAQRCGCELDGDAWMIGDNPVADIGGAVACGVRSIWIRMGRSWPADLDHRPTLEVDSFPEAVEALLGRTTA